MDNTPQNLQERLRKLRGSLSQAAFARLCGLTQQSYTRYEAGQSIPGTAALAKISQQSNVSIQWLISGVEETRPFASGQPELKKESISFSPGGRCEGCATKEKTIADLSQAIATLTQTNATLAQEVTALRRCHEKTTSTEVVPPVASHSSRSSPAGVSR